MLLVCILEQFYHSLHHKFLRFKSNFHSCQSCGQWQMQNLFHFSTIFWWLRIMFLLIIISYGIIEEGLQTAICVDIKFCVHHYFLEDRQITIGRVMLSYLSLFLTETAIRVDVKFWVCHYFLQDGQTDSLITTGRVMLSYLSFFFTDTAIRVNIKFWVCHYFLHINSESIPRPIHKILSVTCHQ